ncbi:hypothetical protein TB2_037339 [Malus domestica]
MIVECKVDLVDLGCLPLSTGLTILVDLDTKQVVEISDKGRSIPILKATNTDYRYSSQRPNQVKKLIKPISIEQPDGPSFTLENDHLVKWAN